MPGRPRSTPAQPGRTPTVCGALGRYDPALVARLADALGVPMLEVHRDRSSVIWADRAPLRWRRRTARGICWSEGLASEGRGVGSWQEAATQLDAFGLALSPGRRVLHTSVSGVTPIYWRDHDGATYFASTADALARSVPGTLHTDWNAWASIFTLRYPLDQRTPFEEIRRLPPFSALRNEGARGRVRRPPWPWAELDPDLDPHAGGLAIFEELVAALEPLRRSGAVVTLSGGEDSRLLLCAAQEAGVPVRALTLRVDGPSGVEADLAARIAAEAGVEHEIVAVTDPERYRDLWVKRLELTDFQFLTHTGLMGLCERLGELDAPILDGYLLDVWAASGKRYFTPEMLAPEAGRAELLAFWRALRSSIGNVQRRAFGRPLGAAMLNRCRRDFARDCRFVLESPNRVLLAHYLTRTLRGIGVVVTQMQGGYARVLTPVAWHRVSRIALAIQPPLKYGGGMYEAMVERAGEPARLPVWKRPRGERRATPQLRFSEPVIDLYERYLREGPLTPWLREPLAGGPTRERIADALRRPLLHRAIQAVTAFHLWAERYSSRLAEPDPSALLEDGEPAEGTAAAEPERG